MSMSSIHVFDGGVIPDSESSGGSSGSANIKNLIMRDFDLNLGGETVSSKILCDYDSPQQSVPYYAPVSVEDMAQWTKNGFNTQVRLESQPRISANLGFLARVSITQGFTANEVTDAKILTYERLDDHRIKFNILNFVKVIDEETSIAYLKLLSTDEFTLDSSVNTTITDILTKIPDTASSTNKLVTNQQLENAIHASVIKWSDVLAVQGSDYSAFTARIAADIAAGIAPVVLDDVNGGAIAILDNVNAGGALFRTSTNCNERDVMFTDYVITAVAASRTTRTRNVLFKNASNGYGTGPDGFVEVKNNRNGIYTYSGNTGGNSLDFLADFDNNTAVDSVRFSAINPPNFAVKIVSTAVTDGTVTVYKKENGLCTPLMPSVAGGTTVEAGKTYQLTCVGDCWTLAEFEEPEQVNFALIGGRKYPVVKIGNQYWMTENLDWKFSDLDIGETTPSDSNPQANYYDDDESAYGVNGNKYGLLYNFPAIERLATLLQAGWRVPTVSDWNALITSVGGSSTAGTKLKSTTGWDHDQNGDGSYGFEAFPAGYLHVSGGSGIFGDIGSYAQFWTSDEFSETNANALMLTLESSPSPTVYDKNYGCSVRLVKDVQ